MKYVSMLACGLVNAVWIAVFVGTERPRWLVAGMITFSAWWLVSLAASLIDATIREAHGLPK